MTKQPSSKNCFVCGRVNPVGLKINFNNTKAGEVTAEIRIPEAYQGYPGVVHGGIIAALLDEVSGRAHMTEQVRFMYTAQLNVSYRKPVPTNTLLLLKGTAGERKDRVAHARGEILDQDGRLLAEAEAVLVDVPQEQLKLLDMDALGWRVYPDEEEDV